MLFKRWSIVIVFVIHFVQSGWEKNYDIFYIKNKFQVYIFKKFQKNNLPAKNIRWHYWFLDGKNDNDEWGVLVVIWTKKKLWNLKLILNNLDTNVCLHTQYTHTFIYLFSSSSSLWWQWCLGIYTSCHHQQYGIRIINIVNFFVLMKKKQRILLL